MRMTSVTSRVDLDLWGTAVTHSNVSIPRSNIGLCYREQYRAVTRLRWMKLCCLDETPIHGLGCVIYVLWHHDSRVALDDASGILRDLLNSGGHGFAGRQRLIGDVCLFLRGMRMCMGP